MFLMSCAHYVVLGNADPIASAYAYSESGCLDIGSLAYGSIDIVSVGTLLSVSICLISQYCYAHIRYPLTGMRNTSVSLTRYHLVGMRNTSVSLIRYHLVGMRNTSVSLIRYRLIGMQYIPISFTTYRFSDM